MYIYHMFIDCMFRALEVSWLYVTLIAIISIIIIIIVTINAIGLASSVVCLASSVD